MLDYGVMNMVVAVMSCIGTGDWSNSFRKQKIHREHEEGLVELGVVRHFACVLSYCMGALIGN